MERISVPTRLWHRLFFHIAFGVATEESQGGTNRLWKHQVYASARHSGTNVCEFELANTKMLLFIPCVGAVAAGSLTYLGSQLIYSDANKSLPNASPSSC